jgi:sulfatase maturation enzyme AslB (radical SAM superfamily)
MLLSDIKWLHVEASTKCNAWCPACPRNKNGYQLVDGLVVEDLSLDRFKEILIQLPKLHAVQFCGNYGDPIAGNNIIELIQLAKQHVKKIQIHTNGGLRSTKWWQQLAVLLQDCEHDVWFGIDGIDEVHEIYRQATSYTKVIQNARAFIQAGGYATWQFIPYQHNEHQLIDCLKTSQSMGFKKFKLVKNARFVDIARDWKTGKEFNLQPWSKDQTYNVINIKNKSIVKEENCMHITQPSVYLAASGKLSTCCYLTNIRSSDFIDDLLKFNIKQELVTNPLTTCLSNCGSNDEC